MVAHRWQKRAEKMHKDGVSFSEIGRRVGATFQQVRYALRPELRERQITLGKIWRLKNLDKAREQRRAWAKANPEKRTILNKKSAMRYQARLQAKETGENVYDIYKRWGVLSGKDVRNGK